MKILNDNEDLRLEYKFVTWPTYEEEFYKTSFTVDIILERYKDELHDFKEEIVIGHANLQLFNYMACQRYQDTIDRVSSCRTDMHFLDFFYDWETEEPYSYWENMLSKNANILNLDRIMIYPKYRGRGIGKLVVKDIFERFYGSCGVIATIVFPLQIEGCMNPKDIHNKKMEYHRFSADYDVAQKKLCDYYRSLGFRRYKDTEIFYLNPFKQRQKLDSVAPRITYSPLFQCIIEG